MNIHFKRYLILITNCVFETAGKFRIHIAVGFSLLIAVAFWRFIPCPFSTAYLLVFFSAWTADSVNQSAFIETYKAILNFFWLAVGMFSLFITRQTLKENGDFLPQWCFLVIYKSCQSDIYKKAIELFSLKLFLQFQKFWAFTYHFEWGESGSYLLW